MLFEIDGLDKDWESGVQSDWEGQLGLHDYQDAVKHKVLRTFDASTKFKKNSSPDVIKVRDTTLIEFRQKLIVHFNILNSRNQVTWPTRSGIRPWVPPPEYSESNLA